MGLAQLLARYIPLSAAIRVASSLAARVGSTRAFRSAREAMDWIVDTVRRNPALLATVASLATAAGVAAVFSGDEAEEALKAEADRPKSQMQVTEAQLAAIRAEVDAANRARTRIDELADGDANTVNGQSVADIQSNYMAVDADVQFLKRMADLYGGFQALRNLQRLMVTEPYLIDLAESQSRGRYDR